MSNFKSKFFGHFKSTPKKAEPFPALKPIGAGVLPQYTLGELAAATEGWKHKLGEGGFGAVYKGWLSLGDTDGDGQEDLMPVAVKRSAGEISADGREQLMTEVMLMSHIKHDNVLALLGWMNGNDTMAMVCEFIPNGDVYELLEKVGSGSASFSWLARLVVCVGCADALAFMHSRDMVHRDFKAQNVLLGEGLVPKIGDFGLARSFDGATHVSTRVAGSRGYLDPEYFQSGHLTPHCDTYAFGLLVLELLTGVSVFADNFIDLRCKAEDPGTLDIYEVVDESMEGQWEEEDAMALVKVFQDATCTSWDERPTMPELLERLREVEAAVKG